MATVLEEKLRKLQERGVTPEGILAVLTGDKREHLMGVMGTGKTLSDADITKLGIGQRGFNTPAERDFLANTMGQGTALTDADITKLGIGERGLNSAAERQYLEKTVNRNNQQFDAELANLSPEDLANVLETLQGLPSREREIYMKYVIENGFDYGTIHDRGTRGLDTPADRQFLKQQQDNWMNSDRVKNLGFSNQQASNSDKRIYPDEIIEELKRQGIILDSEVFDVGIPGNKQVRPRGVVA